MFSWKVVGYTAFFYGSWTSDQIWHFLEKDRVEEALQAILTKYARVVLDFEELEYIDASALGTMVVLVKHARRYGLPRESVSVRNTSRMIRSILKNVSFDKLLHLEEENSMIAIKAPYWLQYDNELHAGGSCNMTSLAMALDFYKKPVSGRYKRTPDRLLDYCDTHGLDRHELSVIQQVSKHFGLGDDASYHDSFDQIKAHLRSGNLVIVQGDFTPSGHVILVCGYDDEHGRWLCNDPAGHWPDYGGSTSGAGVWYDSRWFRKGAAPDGMVWAHLLHP